MDAVNPSHEGKKGRRLPVKGDKKNISELTAIARIKMGDYPKERLPDEYKQLLFEDMTELMVNFLGKDINRTKFEETLKKLSNQMVENFFKEIQQTEKSIEQFIKENQWKEKLLGVDRPHPKFETYLKKLCIQLVERSLEACQSPLVTEKQIDDFIKEINISHDLAPKIKNIFQGSEKQLRQSPREMTWLEHLKRVGNRSHEKRQDAIRKMSTIHYARWFIVDEETLPGLDGAHLVFTSNFDGNLEDYLDDFANVDEGPLNLVFGHCMGWTGARPVDGFIRYVKEHEYPALIFYANYPLATVGEVRRALDWKTKTQRFIEEDVPKLLDHFPAGSGAVVREILSRYLNELAKPTSKNEEQKIGHGSVLKLTTLTENPRQNHSLTV